MLRTSGSDYRDYLEIMLHLLEKKKSVERMLATVLMQILVISAHAKKHQVHKLESPNKGRKSVT